MFWDKFCNRVVKSPHFVVAKCDGVKSHKGLSALIFLNVKSAIKIHPCFVDHGIV